MDGDRADQLSRSQRAHSYQNLAFSPLAQLTKASSSSSSTALNRLTSSTPATPLLAPRQLEAHQFPFDAVYSSRGFEVDPFDTEAKLKLPNRHLHRRKESLGVGKGALGTRKAKSAVFYRDSDWQDRLSAKASAFGGWTEGERRVEEWTLRFKDETDSEGSDEEEDEEELPATVVDTATSLARTKSSLSVFHDEFEHCEAPHPASSPFASPSLSHSRLASLSSTSSPASTRSSLPPQTPLTMSPTTAHSILPGEPLKKDSEVSPEHLDTLAQTVLASQDRFGLFAYIESFLEWPWSPKAAAPPETDLYHGSYTPHSSYATSPDLSRSPSFKSLSESGELSAYYRAKSESDLRKKLEWEKGERENAASGLGIHSSDGEERHSDGIGAVMDVLAGLNNLV